jgi:hypothetical protein
LAFVTAWPPSHAIPTTRRRRLAVVVSILDTDDVFMMLC